MKCKALRPIAHDRETYNAGDIFHVRDEYAREMERAGIVKCFPPEPAPEQDPYPPGQAWPPVPRLWPGETVICCARGPSIKQAQVDACRGKVRLITVNDSWRMAPWADMLYACDGEWWETYARQHTWVDGKKYPSVLDFPGLKVTQDKAAAEKYGLLHIPSFNLPGISLNRGSIFTGGNSGFQALNVALHAVGKGGRIGLLGYDMKPAPNGKRHDFGDHPGRLCKNSPYKDFAQAFRVAEPEIKRAGVRVLNLTPGSALNCFPFHKLDDLLGPLTGTEGGLAGPLPPAEKRPAEEARVASFPAVIPPAGPRNGPQRGMRLPAVKKTESLRTIVTFLWDQPNLKRRYRFEHAEALADQLERWMKTPYRFVLITDNPRDTDRKMRVIETPPGARELAHCRTPEDFNKYPSSYRRLWLFSQEARSLGEHILLTDVDVVVTADWSHLFDYDADFVGWQPGMGWGNLEDRLAGGMYCLRTGTHAEVYEDFIRDPELAIRTARAAGYRGSDQAWLSFKLVKRAHVWPKEAGVFSVRDMTRDQRFVHTDRPPDGACVCHFNGDLNPWDDELQRMHPWIKQYWPKQKVNA